MCSARNATAEDVFAKSTLLPLTGAGGLPRHASQDHNVRALNLYIKSAQSFRQELGVVFELHTHHNYESLQQGLSASSGWRLCGTSCQ